jgi:hypothetical protein
VLYRSVAWCGQQRTDEKCLLKVDATERGWGGAPAGQRTRMAGECVECMFVLSLSQTYTRIAQELCVPDAFCHELAAMVQRKKAGDKGDGTSKTEGDCNCRGRWRTMSRCNKWNIGVCCVCRDNIRHEEGG